MNSPPPDTTQAPALQGNAQWFADEVHSHDSSLKGYLRRAFPTVPDTDDLVQESYLRIWRRHLDQPIASAKAFLFTIARRLALDAVRRQGNSPLVRVPDLVSQSVIEERPCAAEIACSHEEIEVLLQAIDRLPARCREVYILRKLKGLSQRDIALRMGISEQTVEVQVGRANRRCEESLRKAGLIRPPQ